LKGLFKVARRSLAQGINSDKIKGFKGSVVPGLTEPWLEHYPFGHHAKAVRQQYRAVVDGKLGSSVSLSVFVLNSQKQYRETKTSSPLCLLITRGEA